MQSRPTQSLRFGPSLPSRGLCLLLAALILCACGARAPQLQPPAIRIVELMLADDNAVQVRLRVRNPVAATLPADTLEFSLSLDDSDLGNFAPAFDLDVPPLGNELIRISTTASADAAALLRRLQTGELARVAYRIEGELTHSDGKSSLPVESRGWLSPTPGKPGSFR